jgi:thiol-disulfide isomerase/thioredoxin
LNLFGLVGLGGCAPASQAGARPPATAARPAAARVQTSRCGVAPQPELAGAPEVIAPHERVPDFLLATEDCQVFDSRELVGKRPFVVVFFASWCSVCEQKMPLVRTLLEERGQDLTSFFVSLDEGAAKADARAFLTRHGLGPSSFVLGRDFLGFALGYDPFRSVPVVVVVGRSGRVVDVQIGVRDGDAERLEQALDLAIDEAPERDRLTFYPPP